MSLGKPEYMNNFTKLCCCTCTVGMYQALLGGAWEQDKSYMYNDTMYKQWARFARPLLVHNYYRNENNNCRCQVYKFCAKCCTTKS